MTLLSLSNSILFNDCLNNLAEIIGISLGTEILFFKYLRDFPESFLGILTSPVIIFVNADLNDSSKNSLSYGFTFIKLSLCLITLLRANLA